MVIKVKAGGSRMRGTLDLEKDEPRQGLGGGALGTRLVGGLDLIPGPLQL